MQLKETSAFISGGPNKQSAQSAQSVSKETKGGYFNMSLIEDVKIEEGFRGMPYQDHLGFDTIAFGTKLPLTREEGELLLVHRMNIVKGEVVSNLHYLTAKPEVWEILYAMAYQMGVQGLLKFKRMLVALRSHDYVEAANQMLDSLWARQTPERANRMADKMRAI